MEFVTVFGSRFELQAAPLPFKQVFGVAFEDVFGVVCEDNFQ